MRRLARNILLLTFSYFAGEAYVAAQPSAPPGHVFIDGSVDPESIPMLEALWMSFVIVDAVEEMDADGVGFIQREIGLDTSSAMALLEYIMNSVETASVDAAASMQRLCRRKGEIASRSDLIRETESIDMNHKRLLERLVGGIKDIVDPSSEQRVHNFAAERRSEMAGFFVVDVKAAQAIVPDVETALKKCPS